MQVNVPADLEALIEKRMSSGAYNSIEEVLRSALLALDEEEDSNEAERARFRAQIEQGYEQAMRGNLISPDEAQKAIEAALSSRRDTFS